MLQYTTFVTYCNFCCNTLPFLSSSVFHQKNLSVTLPTLEIPYGDPTPSADPTLTRIHITSDDTSTIHIQPNPSYHLLVMGCQQQQWAPTWRMKLNMSICQILVMPLTDHCWMDSTFIPKLLTWNLSSVDPLCVYTVLHLCEWCINVIPDDIGVSSDECLHSHDGRRTAAV